MIMLPVPYHDWVPDHVTGTVTRYRNQSQAQQQAVAVRRLEDVRLKRWGSRVGQSHQAVALQRALGTRPRTITCVGSRRLANVRGWGCIYRVTGMEAWEGMGA
ncbi:hypothetical protein SAY87_016856 [Trapa incisa]|uniref:Uncharacterized protein n=1 Tax=Trapa incisa TaxID=236973 RepID=A0AAN7L9A7_9MYRT|nr:hypothetical protein SAY87_016856 [Trapa incisa]